MSKVVIELQNIKRNFQVGDILKTLLATNGLGVFPDFHFAKQKGKKYEKKSDSRSDQHNGVFDDKCS